MVEKVLFHQDNAPTQTTMKAMTKLNELNYKFFHRLWYYLDLSPSDYYLFPNLKRWLQRKRFASDENVECDTDAHFSAF